MDKAYTKIFLEDVRVCVPIGLLPAEKQAPQDIVVGVELYVDAPDYIETAAAQTIIDYVPFYDFIKGWERHSHTDLIETYLQRLKEFCFQDARIKSCKISIRKPNILQNATAGVEVMFHRSNDDRMSKI